ncbi:MAG: septum formation protein Maf [Candidatus Moranbacteria bacterium RIFOXYA12_FULL_35_19]|nr:MAG: Septum formation protein Maf [Candidatus Moranbacteria bacterium GW2011_GWF2_35_39]OGI31548.1 MAG: septum formation protein Maf [Candidatus Moranbacteria bacterium RIFOXYB12_FULL_35_8]OGI32953.1 MAG: septum formation protein Maf [Candidatus Moranbacteria bacterium RIFOXYC12_FULL_36_13]OGI35638.1 MAG: septum formation protein Maf [Candidatus Moranbacteria bacterium RIFOXYA12_FULL_35_19]
MIQQRKIVLASESSRRKALLEQMGLEFEVCESEYEEDMAVMSDPYELVKFLARKKGEDVAKHYEDAIIISGDTFTIFEEKFIGKPKDEEDAKQTLRNFSGKTHEIISGFAIIDTKNKITINDFGKALVKFRDLSEEEIADYVATKEPLSRGGAYGMMELGAVIIESIEGDFYSVIGLPLNKIYPELKKMGVDILKMKKV